MIILKVLAIAVICLIALYVIGGLIFAHKIVVKKSHVIIVILCAALIGVSSYFSGKSETVTVNGQTYQIPEYQKTIPPKDKAPRIVQTITRYYPTATFQESNGVTTLNDYYYYDNGNWIFSNRPISFETAKIKVYNR